MCEHSENSVKLPGATTMAARAARWQILSIKRLRTYRILRDLVFLRAPQA